MKGKLVGAWAYICSPLPMAPLEEGGSNHVVLFEQLKQAVHQASLQSSISQDQYVPQMTKLLVIKYTYCFHFSASKARLRRPLPR